jgi:hypothetical protein
MEDGNQLFYLQVHGDYRGFEDESGDYSSKDFKRESEDVQEATIAIAKIPSKLNPGKVIGDHGVSDASFTFEQGMHKLNILYDAHIISIRPYTALGNLAEAGIIVPASRR